MKASKFSYLLLVVAFVISMRAFILDLQTTQTAFQAALPSSLRPWSLGLALLLTGVIIVYTWVKHYKK